MSCPIDFGEDPYDDFAYVEQRHLNQMGFNRGYTMGEEAGWRDGYAFGIRKGVQLCAEIGYYQGFAHAWITMLEHEDVGRQKKLNALHSLLEMTRRFPKSYNLMEDDALIKLARIRAKFNQVNALVLGTSVNHPPTTSGGGGGGGGDFGPFTTDRRNSGGSRSGGSSTGGADLRLPVVIGSYSSASTSADGAGVGGVGGTTINRNTSPFITPHKLYHTSSGSSIDNNIDNISALGGGVHNTGTQTNLTTSKISGGGGGSGTGIDLLTPPTSFITSRLSASTTTGAQMKINTGVDDQPIRSISPGGGGIVLPTGTPLSSTNIAAAVAAAAASSSVSSSVFQQHCNMTTSKNVTFTNVGMTKTTPTTTTLLPSATTTTTGVGGGRYKTCIECANGLSVPHEMSF